jgi:uncharacterized protein
VKAPFLKESTEGTHLAIKLQPRASRQKILGVHGSELRMSVTAPPVDAAANRALIEFLGELLQVSRSQIELIRGQTSRHKTVRIKGLSPEKILERLNLTATAK